MKEILYCLSLSLFLVALCAWNWGQNFAIYSIAEENKQIGQELDELRSLVYEAYDQAKITDALFRANHSNKARRLDITGYTASREECDEDPGITAILERPIAGGTCAVSRDLTHWLGCDVYVEGVGVLRVNDLMHPRFNNRLDLVFARRGDAENWGLQKRTVVRLN